MKNLPMKGRGDEGEKRARMTDERTVTCFDARV